MKPMSLTQASEMIGVAPSTLRKWADSGSIESFRTAGGHRRFHLEEVQRYIQRGSSVNTAEILIVDDDFGVRELLQEVLKDAGYSVRVCSSARDGILAINKKMPDMLLLDIAMPGMDGWEMMRKIRTQLGVTDLPIVVFSGVADLKQAGERGAQGYAQKPFDPRALIAQIEAILAAK